MTEKSSTGLLVGARPPDLAEMVCRRIVDGVRIVDGSILLDADPAWAINTVLVKRGVRVSEARRRREDPLEAA